VTPRHVYIHVPFCARRCVYCDFSIAVRKIVPVDAYVDAIAREIDARFGRHRRGATTSPNEDRVETLYLGGGTPSKLGAEGIARLLDVVRNRWAIDPAAEVTIEANPEDVSETEAAAWRATGVNRVSLGVQSFHAGVLEWMHRTHDVADVETAARALRSAGLDDWSLDLIFALPPELNRAWSDDLARAIDLEPDHVSAYGLTVEPQTPLRRWRDRGQAGDANDEHYEEEFLEADRTLGAAGFEHYEVSNYARPGHRARHNSAYWRRVAYVGLGPSAHSFDGAIRRWNEREYAAWRTATDRGRDPIGGAEELTPDGVRMEQAYLGLRTSDGMELSDENRPDFERWNRHGWAVVGGGTGRLTPLGWLRLDALVADLTSVRSR
jgi:putative oxygen-independent coproporphyrinogen III oxidase